MSLEESVSIDRQIESCMKYAEAQRWQVVATLVDDGVSASHAKPEQRIGWRAVLDLEQRYDVVIVWKIDRLARRVLDFLHADEALQERNAAVVSATEPIDMSTSAGRGFATLLSVFGQMEAEAISARVAGARDHLIRHRRAVGGTVPYGYRNVKNPHGPGKVIEQDPERIEFVAKAAARALAGDTVYSIKRWLSEVAPLPKASQKQRTSVEWAYSTVDRLLRNPILAGMIAYNPGRAAERDAMGRQLRVRGDEVLRDEDGLPVVDELLAVITTDERRRMLDLLDRQDKAQRRPRASREITSPLLSGLATCGECGKTMHRGTTAKRPVLTCPQCFQTISTGQLTAHIVMRLLAERGDEVAFEVQDATGDNSAEIADIEEAVGDVLSKMSRDDADLIKLTEQLEGLKNLRKKARDSAPTARHLHVHEYPVRQEWESATTDEERRAVLVGQMASLRIVRGKVGRYLDVARVLIEWRSSMPAGEAMAEFFESMRPGDTYTSVPG